MGCASGCPRRLRRLLLDWGWRSVGCDPYVFFIKQLHLDLRLSNLIIRSKDVKKHPTRTLCRAIRLTRRYRWRLRVGDLRIARDVARALLLGLADVVGDFLAISFTRRI